MVDDLGVVVLDVDVVVVVELETVVVVEDVVVVQVVELETVVVVVVLLVVHSMPGLSTGAHTRTLSSFPSMD